MEGRKPPPRSSHPFPNVADLNKFWNTPMAPAFFKLFFSFLGVYGTVIAFNCYLTRHEKGPFGTDISMTKEQSQKQDAINRGIGTNLTRGLVFNYNSIQKRNLFGDQSYRFDDGIESVAPDVNFEQTKTSGEYGHT